MKWFVFLLLGAAACIGSNGAVAFGQTSGINQATVTLLPKNGGEPLTPVKAAAVRLKVGGKMAKPAQWRSYAGAATGTNLQLVLLIDNSARTTLGLHLKEIESFIQEQAPSTAVGVAYMQNGGAHFLQTLTTDHTKAAAAVRLPQSVPGGSPGPYFSLSDLAKHWPDAADGVRREVVMITDGVDRYYGLRFDPNDPYVNSAVKDALRQGIVVFAIYFRDAGGADQSLVGANGGQNYLIQVAQATGGRMFYEGFGNPVNMAPFFTEINTWLGNQYELAVAPKSLKSGLQPLKVMVSTPNTKVQAPQQIFVGESH